MAEHKIVAQQLQKQTVCISGFSMFSFVFPGYGLFTPGWPLRAGLPGYFPPLFSLWACRACAGGQLDPTARPARNRRHKSPASGAACAGPGQKHSKPASLKIWARTTPKLANSQFPGPDCGCFCCCDFLGFNAKNHSSQNTRIVGPGQRVRVFWLL